LLALAGFFQGVKNLFQAGADLFGHLLLEGVDCPQFLLVESVYRSRKMKPIAAGAIPAATHRIGLT
jgi:hypothetical protein